MVIGLAIGCAMPPATSTPASKYPADISGRVTIAEKFILFGRENPPSQNEVFWLVDISVKNKAYEHAVTADYKEWAIVAGGEVYQVAAILRVIEDPSSSMTPSMNVPSGHTGGTTIGFEVPSSLKVSDAQICYRGQAPHSYGILTGGDKVVAYDWDSKKSVTEEEKPEEQPTESYVVREKYGRGSYNMDLKTVEYWEGEDSREIRFQATKSPLVINYGYIQTSELRATFIIEIQGGIYQFTSMWGSINGAVLEGTGEYVIKVQSSGCKWWIKIGVE